MPTDDYGSTAYTSFTFPLVADANRLYSGSLTGVIGPEDTSDQDWFKVSLLKGATYEFKLTGGQTVYDLNDAVLEFYSTNGTTYIGQNSFDYSISSRYGSTSATLTTSPITATGDYFLKVRLDSYPDPNDVGTYSLRVDQLTEGHTTYLTKTLQSSMNDDFGSRYTSAYALSLPPNSSGLGYASINGVIGPDDTTDQDWFKISLLKGATYEFKLTGGQTVYDLNDAVLEFYSTNGTTYIGQSSFDYSISSNYGTTFATLSTSPITASGDYFLKVRLDSYPDANDVGSYTLQVEQLTPGFGGTAPASSATTPRSSTPAANMPAGTTVNNFYGDYINQSGNSGVINNQQNNSGTINNNQTNTVSIGQILNTNNYTPDYFSSGSKRSDSITGTSSNDSINGKSGADVLQGGVGNDNITGGSGYDTIIGGEGSNIINAGSSSKDADAIYIGNKTADTSADIIKSCGTKDTIYIDAQDFYIQQIEGGLGIFNEGDILQAAYSGTRLTVAQLESIVQYW